jgi:hypothetical protein
MIIITLTGEGLDRALRHLAMLAETADRTYELRVAIDPLDSGLKFKVNQGVWSPPCPGEIHE